MHSYNKTLSKIIKHNKLSFEYKQKKLNAMINAKGRLLADVTQKKAVKSTFKELDEEENVFNSFNKEYRTSYIRPLTYKYNEDSNIIHHINFY